MQTPVAPDVRPARVSSLSLVAWLGAVLCCVPWGLFVGHRFGTSLTDLVRPVADGVVDAEEAAASGASLWIGGALASGGLVLLLLRTLRRRTSSWRVSLVCRGRPNRAGVTVGLTVALWVVTTGTFVFVVSLVNLVETDPETIASTEPWRQPLWLVLAAAGLVATALVGNWAHARTTVFEPLEQLGVVRIDRERLLDQEPLPLLTALRIWVLGLGIDAALSVGAWVDGLSTPDHPGPGAFLLDWGLGVTVAPATLCVLMLLGMLVLPRTHRIGRRVLTHPRTKLSLAGAALGGVLTLTHQETAASIVLIVVSVVIAATSLQLIELGPQPWLGVIVLVFYWLVGFAADGEATEGTLAVPTTVVGWLLAAVGTALAVWGVVGHVRDYLGRVRSPDAPATIAG